MFPSDPEGRPRHKLFLDEMDSQYTGYSSVVGADIYTVSGTRELLQLFDEAVVEFPKPSELIRQFVEQTTEPGDIVMDFFAGSGTTAHAVMLQNRLDGGNRNFILVQLPEQTGRIDYPTIADVCKERVRRTFALLEENNEEPNDTGFKVFKLASSNFKTWNASEHSSNVDELEHQLKLFSDNVIPGRSKQELLFEILLKSGLQLSASVHEVRVARQTVFSIEDGALFICLDDHVTFEMLEEMAESGVQNVVCLDAAFHGNDNLKTNAKLLMESHGIEFHTV